MADKEDLVKYGLIGAAVILVAGLGWFIWGRSAPPEPAPAARGCVPARRSGRRGAHLGASGAGPSSGGRARPFSSFARPLWGGARICSRRVAADRRERRAGDGGAAPEPEGAGGVAAGR